MTRRAGYLVGAAVFCLAACDTGTAASQSSSAPAGQTEGWPDKQGANDDQIGAPPPFPSSLAQWSLQDSWSDMPRAFTDQQTKVAGPNFSVFPSTMNGCDDQRFLVRWRAVTPETTVTALALDDAGGTVAEGVGASGWMDIDGCSAPVFEFASSGYGSSLTDVTVQVEQWVPAP